MWYNWRKHHECTNFEQDDEGMCIFCRLNENLIHKGFEAVPYDMPGAYDAIKGEPRVILQSLHAEPTHRPS